MSRRPLSWLPRISCNDACHKARRSLGGTDYAVIVGTPVYAMFSGTARYWKRGTGGYTITIYRDGFNQIGETMHLSRSNGFDLGGASRHVTEGDLIGYSGGAIGHPGAGSSTGPHLHAHVIVDGIRYGMEEYLANPAWAASAEPIKIEEERKTTMTTNYLDKSTLDTAGNFIPGVTIYITAGDSPGTPANWIEYTRTGKDNDRAVIAFKQHGPHMALDAAEIAKLKSEYLAPLTLGTEIPISAAVDLSSETIGGLASAIATAVLDASAARLSS